MFLRTLIFSLTLLFANCLLLNAQEKADANRPATLKIVVQDNHEQPVPQASVEIVKWTGKWEPWGEDFSTDKVGHVTIKRPPVDQYSAAVIRRPKFAPALQNFTLGAGEQRTITVKLAPPVRGWIEVTDENNQPVSGAQTSSN